MASLVPESLLAHASELSTTFHPVQPIRCSAYVIGDGYYCSRARSIASFGEVNRSVARGAGSVPPPPARLASTAEIGRESQVRVARGAAHRQSVHTSLTPTSGPAVPSTDRAGGLRLAGGRERARWGALLD